MRQTPEAVTPRWPWAGDLVNRGRSPRGAEAAAFLEAHVVEVADQPLGRDDEEAFLGAADLVAAFDPGLEAAAVIRIVHRDEIMRRVIGDDRVGVVGIRGGDFAAIAQRVLDLAARLREQAIIER